MTVPMAAAYQKDPMPPVVASPPAELELLELVEQAGYPLLPQGGGGGVQPIPEQLVECEVLVGLVVVVVVGAEKVRVRLPFMFGARSES